jgi:mono/diheme cytochrome c family protein
MFTPDLQHSTVAFALVIALVIASPAAYAAGPNLGKPVNPADIAAWDSSIMPDGTGLPAGRGTSIQGAPIYAAKCASCHGENGKGGLGSALSARGPITSINAAEKTIGNFWPYATTLFDYIRRAMPWQQPKTLTSDEVYALTAYVLALNQVIGENDAMTAATLPKVRMPNRDGFIVRFPDRL